MNHGSSRLYPGESGKLVNGLTNLEASEADGVEPFVVHSAHQVRRQIPIWPGENKRLSARAQDNLLHPCLSVFFFFSIFVMLKFVLTFLCFPSRPIRLAKTVFIWVGGKSFSAIHDVNWDPDCSSIPSLDDGLSASWQFQVSPLSLLPWPFSSLPSRFPLPLSHGPHWEYCSDPGLWAPKPVLILFIDRPENFLLSAAGPAPRCSHSSILLSRRRKQGLACYLCLLSRQVLLF